MKNDIKVGVIGLGRGSSFMKIAALTGMRLVAICDHWTEKLQSVARELNVTGYEDFDRFLEHDMDAVIPWPKPLAKLAAEALLLCARHRS